MKPVFRSIPVLVSVALVFSACEKQDKASFFTHQFSIRVPEFLEISPEVSLERFSSITPRLDSVSLLKQSLPEAPEEVRPQISRWVVEPHTLNVYQVKQDQVQVFMLGPSSGSPSDDRKFRETMEESITDQVKSLVSEVTPTRLEISDPYPNTQQRSATRRGYSR